MMRWLPAVLLALVFAVTTMAASADVDDQIKTVTQKIEKSGLVGTALAEAYMERAALHLMQQDTPGALSDYDQAVTAAPKLAEAYIYRSFAHIEAGDLPHAADDLSQALTLGPADPAAAYYLRAAARAKMKDYKAALADYDQAIALDKGFGHAYIGRGTARLETGDDAGALADLNTAINGGAKLYRYAKPFRLDPHFEVVFTKINWAVGSPDKAPATAYLGRGRLRLKTGNYEQARGDLEQAVASDNSDNPDPWLYRGLENLALNRCWNGEHDLDKAAELMEKPASAVIQAQRDFIAKTPCAEDVLE
jgi:tetratricopeptide (TPR) repeat protein